MNATEYMEFFKRKSLNVGVTYGAPFSTGKVDINIYMSNLEEEYILAEFASLLSGTVNISIDVVYSSFGSIAPISEMYIEDEKGNIVHSQRHLGPISGFEVKSGKKYKLIALTKNNGSTGRTKVNWYEINSRIVDDFMPILIKESEVSE